MYVFDSGPLIDLFNHYYPEQFPTLWERFDRLIDTQAIVSVREVRRELEQRTNRLADWVAAHPAVFPSPTAEEGAFIREIFQVRHFQALIGQKERLRKSPLADPFVIARAKLTGFTVVTTEARKPNAAKIPNICERFGVPCINLQDFMRAEEWTF